MQKIFFCIGVVIIFISCKSTGAILPYNGAGTSHSRDGISELQSNQAESAVITRGIEGKLEQHTARIDEIIRELDQRTGNDGSVDTIFKRIRDRPVYGTNGKGETPSKSQSKSDKN